MQNDFDKLFKSYNDILTVIDCCAVKLEKAINNQEKLMEVDIVKKILRDLLYEESLKEF